MAIEQSLPNAFIPAAFRAKLKSNVSLMEKETGVKIVSFCCRKLLYVPSDLSDLRHPS